MAQRPRAAKTDAGALPVATYLLILTQVVVWLVVRRFLLSGNAWTDFAVAPGAPRELGLLISPFVHLEPAHLGANLLVLWLFGTNLERVLGSLRFLGFYLGAAWFASLMQWAVFTSFHVFPDLSTQNAAVGSSGAIAGLLGASLVRFPRVRMRIPFFPAARIPATPIIVLWLAYTVVRALVNTISGVMEGVGHWAHFGGFVFGLTAAQLWGLHRIARQEFLERAAREAAATDDLHAAAQAWSALLVLRPLDPRVRGSLISLRMVMADLPGARRLAREGLEALIRAQERQLTLEAYRDYSRLVPDLDLPPGVRYRIGCWLAEAGDNETAFRALWESVREDGATPSAAGALYRAGQIAWERLRSAPRARDAWERLLEQFPDSPWTDAARDALRRLPAAGRTLPS
jgi:membrane associated rhomboid family serine protease